MDRIRKHMLNNFDIIMFVSLMFIKVLSLNLVLNLMDFNASGFTSGCMGSVLLFSAVFCLFNISIRSKLLLAVDFVISLILFTDSIYNRYFYDVTSVALIKQARLVGEVGDSVRSLIKPLDFLYFIDIIIFVLFFKRIKNRTYSIEKVSLKRRAVMLIFLLILGFSFSYKSVKALDKRQPGILKTLYDKKYIVSNIGDLNFHMVDIYKYLTNNVLNKERINNIQKQQVLQWFENKNKISGKKFQNTMAGKNLIIVQLESFQGFVLNRKVNGKELTPNLNKLAKESMVFNNYYSQTAWGGTSDAEFLSNVSLLPARDGSVFYLYSSNTYDSIITQLKKRGYYTAAMHGNRPGFWNRGTMYSSLGVDKFESEKDYKIDEIQGMGLGDKSFFRQSVEKFKNYPQPFYALLVSMSSHFPYKDRYNRIKDILNVGEFEGTIMGDYLKSIRYSDEAIGEFVTKLKKDGLWDNSVVVFYGDHPAIPYSKKEELAELLYGKKDITELEWFKAQNIVSMIHFPNDAIKGSSDMVCGQMDLAPTLGNLFGFKLMFELGQDLLNAKAGFYVHKDGFWADDKLVYLKNLRQVVDIKTGEMFDSTKCQSLFKRAEEYKRNSDAVLENNLVKYFQEKDNSIKLASN